MGTTSAANPRSHPLTVLRAFATTARLIAALFSEPVEALTDPFAALLPAESMALTVALAQVERGETPSENVSTLCVLALARVSGRHDYTAVEAEETPGQVVQ